MVCIVGALSVDLLICRDRFRKGTSNPASIRFSPGGVGYRIYSHLESPKMMFTALGSDVFGKWLMESLSQPQWVNPIFLDQYPSACYCALMQSGELLYGAADMAVIERGLTWERLRARLPDLGEKDFLVLEANLSPELVRSLISHAGARTRVVFESVSVEKLLRHAANLENLYLLSGNEDELRALGGYFAAGGSNSTGPRKTGSDRSARSDTWLPEYLAQRNIENLLMTRGSRGVRLYRKEDSKPLSLRPSKTVATEDTTGAGDTLLSAYLQALEREIDTEDALRQAVRNVERRIEEGSL